MKRFNLLILISFLCFFVGMQSCVSPKTSLDATNPEGETEGSGDELFETGEPIAIPLPPSKLQGGIDVESLEFQETVCPSGVSGCFGTLSGALLPETPAGTRILQFDADANCISVTDSDADQKFEVAIQTKFVDTTQALMPVSSDSSCEEIISAGDPVYYVVLPNGAVLSLINGTQGALDKPLIMVSRGFIYQSESDAGEGSVLRFDYDTYDLTEILTGSINGFDRHSSSGHALAILTLGGDSSAGAENELCLLTVADNSVVCDGHSFTPSTARVRNVDEGSSSIVAEYTEEGKTTFAVYNDEAELVNADAVMDPAVDVEEVASITFQAQSRTDSLLIAKVYEDDTSVLQTYNIRDFSMTGFSDDKELHMIYEHTEPMKDPIMFVNGVLMRCGPMGEEELCFLNTGDTHPTFFSGQGTTTLQTVDVGETGITGVESLFWTRASDVNYGLIGTDQGIYLLESDFLPAETRISNDERFDALGTNFGQSGFQFNYYRPVGIIGTIWNAQLEGIKLNISATSNPTSLRVTGAYIDGGTQDVYLVAYEGSVAEPTFKPATVHLVLNDYVNAAITNTDSIYFMRGNERIKATDVNTSGFKSYDLFVGVDSNTYAGDTLTLVVEGGDGVADPVTNDDGTLSLNRTYQIEFTIP